MWSSYDLIIYYLDVLDILGVVGILNPISGTVGMKLTPGPEGMGGGVLWRCGPAPAACVSPSRPVLESSEDQGQAAIPGSSLG